MNVLFNGCSPSCLSYASSSSATDEEKQQAEAEVEDVHGKCTKACQQSRLLAVPIGSVRLKNLKVQGLPITRASALAKFRRGGGRIHRSPFTPRGTSCPTKAVTIVAVDVTYADAKPFWNTLAENGVCTAVSSDGPFAVVHADTGVVNRFAK